MKKRSGQRWETGISLPSVRMKPRSGGRRTTEGVEDGEDAEVGGHAVPALVGKGSADEWCHVGEADLTEIIAEGGNWQRQRGLWLLEGAAPASVTWFHFFLFSRELGASKLIGA